MNDPSAVHIGECRDQLTAEGSGATLRKAPLALSLDERAEVTTGGVFHHKAVEVTRLEVTQRSAQVRWRLHRGQVRSVLHHQAVEVT